MARLLGTAASHGVSARLVKTFEVLLVAGGGGGGGANYSHG